MKINFNDEIIKKNNFLKQSTEKVVLKKNFFIKKSYDNEEKKMEEFLKNMKNLNKKSKISTDNSSTLKKNEYKKLSHDFLQKNSSKNQLFLKNNYFNCKLDLNTLKNKQKINNLSQKNGFFTQRSSNNNYEKNAKNFGSQTSRSIKNEKKKQPFSTFSSTIKIEKSVLQEKYYTKYIEGNFDHYQLLKDKNSKKKISELFQGNLNNYAIRKNSIDNKHKYAKSDSKIVKKRQTFGKFYDKNKISNGNYLINFQQNNIANIYLKNEYFEGMKKKKKVYKFREKL